MSEEQTKKKRSRAKADGPEDAPRSANHEHDGHRKKKARYEVGVHHDKSNPAPYRAAGHVPEDHFIKRPSQPASQTLVPPTPTQASKSQNGEMPAIPPLPPLPEGDLAKQVFTHASMDPVANYERLELLGDAYLELMAVRFVFDRYPKHAPKHMSQIRERLACNNTLHHFAGYYQLADRVVSQGMHDSSSEKMVADVFEAYIAAIILSDPAQGFATAEAWLVGLWTTLLNAQGSFVSPATTTGVDAEAKDKLNRLLWCKPVKIEYRSQNLRPEDRANLKGQTLAQLTRIGVFVTWEREKEVEIASAVGIGKKEAGLKAAEAALKAQEGPLVGGLAKRKTVHEAERRAKQYQQLREQQQQQQQQQTAQ